MPHTSITSAEILSRCREAGFALAGICRAEPTNYEEELRDWLAAGKHGEMDYLQRNIELRIDPRALVPGAKSIIVVADRYESDAPATSDAAPSPQQPTGRIARYARGDDYHNVMRKRLTKICRELQAMYPDQQFRACVDTAPVLEREHAQRAGLGAVGKNTLIIQRGVGSYLLLGEIITTLALEPSAAAAPDPCGSCTRCIDACPTQAITPWSVDAARCISYLTIEHRGVIDERFHEAIGDWIFGCDICQEVCPHNQPTQRRTPRLAEINPAFQSRRSDIPLLEALNWNEESRREVFIKSAMKRAKLNMMKRNALIAAGNALRKAHDPTLLARINAIAVDPQEDEIVRATAAQVLARVKK